MHYVVYRDRLFQWRWRLAAANGQTIADSGEGYMHKSDCLAAINLVKGSFSAPVYHS